MTDVPALRAAIAGLISFAAGQEQVVLAAASQTEPGDPSCWAALPLIAHVAIAEQGETGDETEDESARQKRQAALLANWETVLGQLADGFGAVRRQFQWSHIARQPRWFQGKNEIRAETPLLGSSGPPPPGA